MPDSIYEMNPQTNPAKIGPDRLKELTEECCTRLKNFRSQMGCDYQAMNGGVSPIGTPNTWLGIRQRAREEYRGEFSHRRLLGGTFKLSWWSMNVPGRFVGELSSKFSDDLVGTDPFFAVMPDNIDDPDKAELSKQVERKVQKDVSSSNVSATITQAIEDALCEGERCVQLSWKVDKTEYPGSATVLVDKDGEPIKTPTDDYIYQYDDVLDVIVDAKGNFVSSLTAALQNETATMGPDGTPQLPQGTFLQSRLEREPAFVMPQNPEWKLFDDLILTITHKKGLVADVILAEDFIWDIYCTRLEDSTLMARCYDAPLKELENTYPGSEYEKKLRLVAGSAKSHAGQPIYGNGEQQRITADDPVMNIHETYWRGRVNKDDKEDSWLFLVLDMINQVPLFCEYLGNMRMKRPPFKLIRGFRAVSTRAYGMGIYQMLEDKALAIDLFFNRLCLKSSKSGSVTWYNPNAFLETKDGADLTIGDEKVYRLQRQSDVEFTENNPPVARVNLNEVDEYSREVMEDLIQDCQLVMGITSAADGSTADLNSTKTATGIRNLERTGNTVQKKPENMIAADVSDFMAMVVDMDLENMDPQEAEWTLHEDKLATLNRDEIRMLPRDVRMLLTKGESSEGIEVAQQILATLKEYYGYPPSLQKQLRPAFIQILKDLNRADADEILHDPTPEELKAASDAQANQAKIQEQFRFNSADIGPLTPYERGQILAKYGVQASPDQEVLNTQQQAAQAIAASKAPAGALGAPLPPVPNVVPMPQQTAQ